MGQLLALEPGSEDGGIYASKPGYHNYRDALPADDYSVSEFAIDRQGDGELASAFDWTFRDAQNGQYGTIEKYSKRLMAAGRAGRGADPRTVYLREFFGNTNGDSQVDGWDFAKHTTSQADSSHLWHVHCSVHRAYANNMLAMKAILSIMRGESVAQWQASIAPPIPATATVVIKALVNGKFVSAENAGKDALVANRDAAGPWETFELIERPDGLVAFRAKVNGLFVTADNAGRSPLIANRPSIGTWECFTLIHRWDGSLALRAAANGQIVSSEAGTRPMTASRSSIGPWERFAVAAPVATP